MCQPFADHARNIQRAKYIDGRYNFLRERILKERIRVDYVSTTDNVADILTKVLARDAIIKFRAMFVLS